MYLERVTKNRKIGNLAIVLWNIIMIVIFSVYEPEVEIITVIILLALVSYTPLACINSWAIVVGPVDLEAGKNDKFRFVCFVSSIVLLVAFLTFMLFKHVI